MTDSMEHGHAEPMPRVIEPMLAIPGQMPPDHPRFAFEVKWDGVRAVVYVEGGRVRATGRRGTDITTRYPELLGVGELLRGHDVILDGEVVAFDELGRPSFERLQQRMHVANPAERGLTRTVPANYLPFDLLYLDGHSVLALPYEVRRELLDNLEIGAPQCLAGDPEVILRATKEQGLEGVVAKRKDSPYRPGARAPWWIKIKNLSTQEVVVAGWQPGKGRRENGIGSLLMGVYGGNDLMFVGHVGTGFTDAMLDDLAELLRPQERATSPFAHTVPRLYARHARWVEPRFVAEVAYTMWTQDGRLRNPVWRGLREDKRPEEVRREEDPGAR